MQVNLSQDVYSVMWGMSFGFPPSIIWLSWQWLRFSILISRYKGSTWWFWISWLIENCWNSFLWYIFPLMFSKKKKYHQRIGSSQSLVAFWHRLYLKINGDHLFSWGNQCNIAKKSLGIWSMVLRRPLTTTLTVYQTIKQRGYQILRRWQLASKLMSAKQYAMVFAMGIRTINTRNNEVVSVTFVYVSTCKYIDNK